MDLKDTLIKKISKYIKESEMKGIMDAIDYAEKNFEGIKHIDETPYIDHVYRTAIILTELHSDPVCITAGLIHWLPEYKENITYQMIYDKFGDRVGNIVESVGKINKLRLKNNDQRSANYLKKILVGLSTDVRVIIIKLAGRLDNLRKVYVNESEERKQKCIETEDVLIPIAHRLGINYIKSELEDLCLKYLKPDAYNEILERLNASSDELNKYLNSMKDSLSDLLVEHGISFYIKGRVKSVHSIYQKLIKGKKWNQIYDILALRIIVSEVQECYTIIGLIHANYRPIENRFKDYIAKPKENMYQSLHTGVIGPGGQIFEVQIRTKEMDEIAEYGIASHWSYKEKGTKSIQNLMEQKLELFRSNMEVNADTDSNIESEFKENFTSNMIYVYTPKGDVLELPEGSTPVDFAYRVHSHIGDTLVAAIVNDQIVPIDYKLENDDLIKIKTNENSKPKKEWLNFVKTSQAKSKIKSFFSKQDREEYIKKGEKLLDSEIKKRKWSVNKTLTKDNIDKILKKLKLKDEDELKLSIGSMRYTANYCLNILSEDETSIQDLMLEKINNSTSKKSSNHKNDILVSGLDNVLINIASCCMPVYGDEIIGYITKGNGITVHKSDCSNIKNVKERLIDVAWNENSDEKYITSIVVETDNSKNILLDIVTKSSQRKLNIESVNTINKDGILSYKLMVKVPNKTALDDFASDLMALPFVKSVRREHR